MDDHRLVCIYKSIQNNLYVDKKYLLKIKPNDKIFRKDNYIVNGFYISKDSKHIIEGSYIYVMKPPLLNKKTLKMIEITPLYDGYKFNINFVYGEKKTKNIPIKNKHIGIDLGVKNVMTIYDPEGEQYIIKGSEISGLNYHVNKKIDRAKKIAC